MKTEQNSDFMGMAKGPSYKGKNYTGSATEPQGNYGCGPRVGNKTKTTAPKGKSLPPSKA